jgi:hypothetical protein
MVMENRRVAVLLFAVCSTLFLMALIAIVVFE